MFDTVSDRWFQYESTLTNNIFIRRLLCDCKSRNNRMTDSLFTLHIIFVFLASSAYSAFNIYNFFSCLHVSVMPHNEFLQQINLPILYHRAQLDREKTFIAGKLSHCHFSHRAGDRWCNFDNCRNEKLFFWHRRLSHWTVRYDNAN